MKKVDKDPFSNGEEHRMFEAYNCDKCIKSSQPIVDKHGTFLRNSNEKNGLPKCSVERDIATRMFNNEPINQKTIDICHDFIWSGRLCPYLKTKRKKYPRKLKNQTSLEL